MPAGYPPSPYQAPNPVPRRLGAGQPDMSGGGTNTSGYGTSYTPPRPAPRRLGMTPEENAAASQRARIQGQRYGAFGQSNLGDPSQVFNMRNDPSYGFNPGIPGDANRNGGGGDWYMGNPGAAEQFFADNLQKYSAGPQGQTNYAADAYNAFLQGSAPNLDPYYDNAKRRAAEDINSNFASRGAYGSSAALDSLGETMTNLNAEQANREGEYDLQRYGLGGQLGSTADQRASASSADSLNWLNSGQGAAESAQGARRTRAQDYFNNLSNTYGGLAQIGGQTYDSMIGDDQALLDAMVGLQAGTAAEGQNQAYRREDQTRDDINNAFSNGIAAYNAAK